MPLRRLAPDWGIPFGLACLVVAFAAGSASEPSVKRFGQDARWVVLVVVCAAALIVATRGLWSTRSLPSRGLLRFTALTAAFLGLAVVSTAWSVTPRLSFERAGSLGILFVLAAALASTTADDVRARIQLFQGLAAGAIAAGLLGLPVLVLDYDAAVQSASPTATPRYRGFTENPNTIAILAGAALPVLVALAIRARSRRHQAAWLAGGMFLLASIIASESRGGLLAACAGTVIVAALGVEGRRHRIASVTALLALFAGGVGLRQVAQPPAPGFSSAVAPAAPVVAPTHKSVGKTAKGTSSKSRAHATNGNHGGSGKGKGNGPGAGTPKHKATRHHAKRRKPRGPKPILVLRTKTQALPIEQYEIGYPSLSKTATTTLASGRLAAWEGALELIGDRPILGYGFGTEQKVFIDRWYFFEGGTAENSYLGLLLQLGGVGLALIAAMGCALAVGAVKTLRFVEGDERVMVVAGLGVLVAAAAIMLIQSYLYSVGNVATATVWISLFVLGSVALEPERKLAASPLPARPHEAAA